VSTLKYTISGHKPQFMPMDSVFCNSLTTDYSINFYIKVERQKQIILEAVYFIKKKHEVFCR